MMAGFFQLRCLDCRKTFLPVVSTEANELLVPDYDELVENMSELMADKLRLFHLDHGGHRLVETELHIVGHI